MPTKFTQLVWFCTLSKQDIEVQFNPMYYELATKRLHYFISLLNVNDYKQARSATFVSMPKNLNFGHYLSK